jgi:hypothetical protein
MPRFGVVKRLLMSTSDPRRQALVDALRSRFQRAAQANDAEAKQALFKEAVYLGIKPDEFTGP